MLKGVDLVGWKAKAMVQSVESRPMLEVQHAKAQDPLYWKDKSRRQGGHGL
jgi:hypothetical protein